LNYEYDVFLSYSSKDVSWAEWLQTHLTRRGIRVYRDKDRLTAGDEWQPQLQDAIARSQHLLVLWSAAARDSDWVMQEQIYFEADHKGSTDTRRLVFLNLETANKAKARYEQINNIKQAGLYLQGPASLENNQDVRKRVLDRLEEALKEQSALPIYKVLMVSTLDAMLNVELSARAGLAPTFGETLHELEIRRDNTDAWKTELANYYGAERSAWRPFGSNQSVDTILDDLRDKVQASPNAPRFRWRDPGEDLWSSDQEDFELSLTNISQHLALIVIDPVSLYDFDVMTRLSQLRSFLKPELCATAVLAPFTIPAKSSQVRKVLKGAVLDIFRQYSDPPFNGSTLHPLTMCAHDAIDVRRVLSSSLDQTLMAAKKQNTTPFLSAGER
jgi:TIR domain